MSFKYQLPVFIISLFCLSTALAQNNIPHLVAQGTATQLIVDDKPFLIFGGELGNSSASDRQYMKPVWPKLVQMNLNTVLAPVYWEFMEPREGQFDFALVDGLIDNARQHNLRLVLLWFGSWKNSMSCYVPDWVKKDTQRFPRARLKNGEAMEIMSAFCDEGRNIDARAFAALMRHLRQIDGEQHTVLMVQVENEVAMLEDARDHSDTANIAFAGQVPQELMDYLAKHKESLIPEFYATWKKYGLKTSGTWEKVFGKGLEADEIFMAWYYAKYVDFVTRAGKAEYFLPMYVNAALIRPGCKPGQYPSAGPLPHLMDVWRAGAPAIDFLSPDIYFSNFKHWCQQYHRSGNPLFIPEADRNPDCAAHVFYAVGAHDAMGFSPFSIESIENPRQAPIAQSYGILRQLSPLILAHQGRDTMRGVLLDKENPVEEITLGNYKLTASHDYTWKYSSGDKEAKVWPRAAGLIISTGSDEYIIAGTGTIVTFVPTKQSSAKAGIVSIEEGVYNDGKWTPGRRLNGDESHQGRHLRIPPGQFGIQRIQLYRYQ
jgi:beta-galactosidase GanA